MGLFSLLTKSTLISLSSLGTGGGRSPFCGCMGIAVRCPVLLFEKLGIKLKNTLHLFMLSGSHQGLCSASIMVCLNLYCVYFKYPLVLE